jgi:succinyl-CoA synthetase beta subunit
MNLLEYQAKTLLAEYNTPLPTSWLIRAGEVAPSGVTFPVVAKSQVPVGGRGKVGGIVVVPTASELPATLHRLFSLPIKEHIPDSVLLEEALDIDRELYLALRLNRDSRAIEWLASPQGGIEIEANAESVKTFSMDEGMVKLPEVLGLPAEILAPVLGSLVTAFRKSDLLLLEINPLVVRPSGALICADAKILVDDNARFRQIDLPWLRVEGNPPKPLGGTIGCIANGAGMAMSTIDTIVARGGRPANFLDIGGGTGEKEFVIALSQIMALPNVTSIIVNIFAGISRCDEIARGIIAAKEQIPDLVPLFIRLEGTNRDIAVSLLADASIPIEPDLASCVRKAIEAKP